MNKLMRCLCAFGLACTVVLSVPAQASTAKKKVRASTHAPNKHGANKAASGHAKSTHSKSKKTVPKPSTTHSCSSQKDRHGHRRRICKSVTIDPVLQSPIQNNALNKAAPAEKATEVKARSAPDRAYAVDGETFFYQGRKYRVSGLNGAGNDDMAKQRLQKSLESGSLMIDPLSIDDAGVSTATVRINGRDLSEQLR